jgi:hypothetical protein
MNTFETIVTALSSGTQTSYTAVDFSSFMPPTSFMGFGYSEVATSSNGTYISMFIRATGMTSFVRLMFQTGSSASLQHDTFTFLPVSSAQSIDYYVNSNMTGTIYLSGYIDNL